MDIGAFTVIGVLAGPQDRTCISGRPPFAPTLYLRLSAVCSPCSMRSRLNVGMCIWSLSRRACRDARSQREWSGSAFLLSSTLR